MYLQKYTFLEIYVSLLVSPVENLEGLCIKGP